LSQLLRESLRSDVRPTLLGEEFQSHGGCCEWLEVVDPFNGHPIGVVLTDFYGGAELENCESALRADNVFWTESWSGISDISESASSANVGRFAMIFLAHSLRWKIQSGPYLPAYFFSGARGSSVFLVLDVRCFEVPSLPELAVDDKVV
jgi:hypothetical protein